MKVYFWSKVKVERCDFVELNAMEEAGKKASVVRAGGQGSSRFIYPAETHRDPFIFLDMANCSSHNSSDIYIL